MSFGISNIDRSSILEKNTGINITVQDNGNIVIRVPVQNRMQSFICHDTDEVIFTLLDILDNRVVKIIDNFNRENKEHESKRPRDNSKSFKVR